jgi:hypothetical protein
MIQDPSHEKAKDSGMTFTSLSKYLQDKNNGRPNAKEHLQLCHKGTSIQHFNLDAHKMNQWTKLGMTSFH